ncbi:MAG: hypothetical protein Q8O24_06265 [Gallionellaceae bacterium]|nr:hypothetical protein [Gallionellaceae bacterium]
MKGTVIDENTLKLFYSQMEALHCVVIALQSTGALNEAALTYVLEARLKGRPADDLTALGIAMLLGKLDGQKKPPQLQLIQGGRSDPDKS